MFLVRRTWLHGEPSEQTFLITALVSLICYLSSLEVTALLKLSLLLIFSRLDEEQSKQELAHIHRSSTEWCQAHEGVHLPVTSFNHGHILTYIVQEMRNLCKQMNTIFFLIAVAELSCKRQTFHIFHQFSICLMTWWLHQKLQCVGERIYQGCIYFPLLHGFSIHGEIVWLEEEDSLAFLPVVQYYYCVSCSEAEEKRLSGKRRHKREVVSQIKRAIGPQTHRPPQPPNIPGEPNLPGSGSEISVHGLYLLLMLTCYRSQTRWGCPQQVRDHLTPEGWFEIYRGPHPLRITVLC